MAQTSRSGISGTAIALATGGGLLIYAGLRHVSPLQALRDIMSGNPPSLPAGNPVTVDLSDFGGGDFAPGTSFSGGGFPQLASAAQKYLGRPYRWAGVFANGGGGDCSGLVYRSFHDIGITDVPRTATSQAAWSKLVRVSRSEVGAGDLTFWPGAPAHIGIAINNTQGIYSPHTGTVVQIQNIDRARRGLVCLRYAPRRVSTGRAQ